MNYLPDELQAMFLTYCSSEIVLKLLKIKPNNFIRAFQKYNYIIPLNFCKAAIFDHYLTSLKYSYDIDISWCW